MILKIWNMNDANSKALKHKQMNKYNRKTLQKKNATILKNRQAN